MRIASVVLNVGSGDPGFAVTSHIGTLQNVAQRDQPVGMRKGKRPQQDALNDREDGGGGPNSQGEHEHGGRSEARRLQQMADCNPKILEWHRQLPADW